MLHADLGGVLDLLVGAVQRRDQSGRGHRAGDADLALATHLGARDRGVALVEHADRAGHQQETHDAVVARARFEAAGNTRCTAGTIPAAPLVGAVTTRPPAAFSSLTASAYALTHSIASSGRGSDDSRCSMRCMRAARRCTLSTPGNRPVACKPAFDAFVHDRPDVQQRGARLAIGTKCASRSRARVRAARARARGHPQQFPRGLERIAARRPAARPPCSLAEIRGAHDEAAAGRVVLLAMQHGAGGIERGETHAVRMLRQRLVAVKQQVERLVERDFVLATRRSRRCERIRSSVGSIAAGSSVSRPVAFETQQYRPVGAVPAARQRQRAVDLGADLARRARAAAESRRSSTNAAAAFIGPIVWELDGPTPILKMSRTLRFMRASHTLRPSPAARRCRRRPRC